MEKVEIFGNKNNLLGIVSEPEEEHSPLRQTAVILLNANVVHRIGPYRLHVDLARKLINDGFLVLRFDLSGVGDSKIKDSRKNYNDRIVSDVQESMSFIEKQYGIKQFVLMGLCAGADSAYYTTITDKRITGLVMIDGYCYKTPGYYMAYYIPRMLTLAVWTRFIKKGFDVISVKFKAEPINNSPEMGDFYVGVRDFPSKKSMQDNLKSFIDRNINMFFIYTGGYEQFYNHKNQFWHMFPGLKSKDKIRVQYTKEAEHTFPVIDHRTKLIDSITEWLKKSF